MVFFLGFMARQRADFDGAEQLFNRYLALAEETNNKVVAGYVVTEFAMLAIGRQDFAAAHQFLRQSLRCFVELEDPWGAIQCLEFSAILAVTEQLQRRAYLLAGAAAGLRKGTNSMPSPQTANSLKAALDTSTGHLARAEATQATIAGQQLTFAEAVALVLVV